MKLVEELENISQLSQIHDYSIDDKTREIYISKEIDGDVLAEFLKNINYLNSLNDRPIIVWVSSDGGDTCSGMGIFDAISLSPAPIILVVCGTAASMMTVIAQAAKIRLITPHSTFMIHEASISMDETATTNATSNVKFMKDLMKNFIDIYANRCKDSNFFSSKSLEYVKSHLKKMIRKYSDWYLTPEDAVKYGFLDGILGGEKYPSINSVINSVYSNNEDIGSKTTLLDIQEELPKTEN